LQFGSLVYGQYTILFVSTYENVGIAPQLHSNSFTSTSTICFRARYNITIHTWFQASH
ncbi:hypothetical protein DOY81_006521, partial [Sarcophaga bullata]